MTLNRKKKTVLIVVLVVSAIYLTLFASANNKNSSYHMLPNDNNGQKWRIGYCETDPFFNFTATLHGLIIGLNELGWISVSIEDIPYEEGQEDSEVIWQWLNDQDVGPYIEFVQDAHYSLNQPLAEEAVLKRLKDNRDLDLMFVMGTYAGRLLANDDHNTPIMVFSSSNAVQSGIIASDTDSGRDHIWAHMDSERYKRQVEVFYDIFHFKKLGLVYEDSSEGRIYAALEDLEGLAKELSFELVTYKVDEAKDEEDKERYHQEIYNAYQKLAQEVDAMYLTAGTRDINRLHHLLTPFYDARIPVFSQMGANEVRHGALLSLYRADFSGIGRFGADNIAQVLKGTKPRGLSQVYGDTPSIVLNMEVAEKIGYKTPFEILLIADEIYQAIEGVK